MITGACRGIGAGIAERFARLGANLVIASNAERILTTANAAPALWCGDSAGDPRRHR
ncbi:SDR family NAD(P)-dependent oxidoreductase [Serratia ureilytica]